MKKITRGLIWFGSFKGKELNVKVYALSHIIPPLTTDDINFSHIIVPSYNG